MYRGIRSLTLTQEKLFKLEEASQFPKWMMQLEAYMYEKIKCANLENITQESTLNGGYFSTHEDFSDKYEEVGFGEKEFFRTCFVHAMENAGPKSKDEETPLKEWVYKAVALIRRGLGDDILEQTAGVPAGDLVGLLEAIKVAVLLFEDQGPVAVVEYYKTTM